MSNRLSTIPVPKIVDHVNRVLQSGQASLFHTEVEDFGSNLSSVDVTTAHTALCVHRFKSKFSLLGDKEQCVERALDSYLSYDKTLPLELNLWEAGGDFLLLRKARGTLHDWLKFASPSLHFDVEFTPGESFTSSSGDVSIVAKLGRKSHWTTTYSCLDDTIHLIYNTLYLKRMAKIHIGPVSREERRQLFNRYKKSPRRGYLIFRELLLQRVLIIVDGARASTVPKNNETDRFINVETTFGCILQRGLANEFLKVLSRVHNNIRPEGTRGYDKTDAQEVHKRMISNPDYATVDFSNASDSISCSVVSGMFPKHISSLLFRWRSHYVLVRDDLYEPIKLSSMGNGFTFETMTLLLLSIARQMDPTARVFGDDVIIKNEFAERFVRVCKIIGFNANMKKTFINSKFRESCGAFYHDDSGYLLSYDIKRCENISDCVVVANKLFHLKSLNTIRSDVRKIFDNMHKEITSLIPTLLKGPPRDHTFALNAYVFSGGWERAHRGSQLQLRNWKSMVDEVRLYNHNVDISNRIVGIIWSPRYKEKYIRVTCRVAGAGANMYAMRRVKRHIRGAGSWTLIPLLVTNSGVVELKLFKSILKTYS